MASDVEGEFTAAIRQGAGDQVFDFDVQTQTSIEHPPPRHWAVHAKAHMRSVYDDHP